MDEDHEQLLEYDCKIMSLTSQQLLVMCKDLQEDLELVILGQRESPLHQRFMADYNAVNWLCHTGAFTYQQMVDITIWCISLCQDVIGEEKAERYADTVLLPIILERLAANILELDENDACLYLRRGNVEGARIAHKQLVKRRNLKKK